MELTTTIYLVRHGQTEANQTGVFQGHADVPLDSSGLEQARRVGERLRQVPFDAILSSDLSRAAVTARAIAGERQVLLRKELREWDLGHWVGLTFAQVAERFPEEYRNFKDTASEGAIEGGESRAQFNARAARVLRDLADEFAGKTILCVTHGGVLKAMFRAAAGVTFHGRFLRTDNTSLSCLRCFNDTGLWQVVTWNDCAHLSTACSADEKFPFK